MPQLTTLTRNADISEVRTALTAAAGELLELRSTPEDRRGDTFQTDLRSVVDYIHDLDTVERALAAGERGRTPQPQGQSQGSRSFGATDGDAEHRSMGRQVTDDPAFEEWTRSGRRGGPLQVEVRNLVGDFSAGGYSGTGFPWLPVGSPQFVTGSLQQRRLFVRDLMSTQNTGLKVIPYVRELNQLTNETGAQMTSEGSAKSEVTQQFENYSAIVEKISAWVPVTDEIMSDAPTLRGYIDNRLTYMIALREEQQVLSGTGTSPQILGLDNVTNIQTQGAVSGDLPATVGQAIGKVENVDGGADGVVINPIDYWTAVTKRYANRFDNGNSSGAPGTADGNITWGLPAVRTRGVATTVGYCANWKIGATLFEREGTNVRVGDQHNDYFIRNLLIILAEKRTAVAWHRPNLFVKMTVPNS